jgi:hypothetical protein
MIMIMKIIMTMEMMVIIMKLSLIMKVIMMLPGQGRLRARKPCSGRQHHCRPEEDHVLGKQYG